MENGEDIDLALRKKRKVREYKSCYPCRRRKVKCNNDIPCTNCRARDHAYLCTYERQEDKDGRRLVDLQLGSTNLTQAWISTNRTIKNH